MWAKKKILQFNQLAFQLVLCYNSKSFAYEKVIPFAHGTGFFVFVFCVLG